MGKLCTYARWWIVAGMSVVTVAVGGWAQRTGAWVDEVVFFAEPNHAKAVAMIQAGAMDLYAGAISNPDLIRIVRDDLGYEVSYGTSWELTFNPVGPTFKDGRLNPFSVPRLREAVNWLVDRDYIAQEILGGAAVPKYLPLFPAFPDSARLADVVRVLELRYAHNPAKARAVITAEMVALGAEFVEQQWRFQGEPVEILLLIRGDDERRRVGDYFATLLEGLGFTATRHYRTAAEVAAVLRDDPAVGRFHVFTAGRVMPVLLRDQGGLFNWFYTPRGRPDPLWQAYTPSPEFDQVADRLAWTDYADLVERRELFARALELALQDSVRVWLVNRIAHFPRSPQVVVGSDLAGGVYGSWLWSRTLRFADRIGGTVRIGIPSLLTEPWNPIAGSTWMFDVMIIRGTSDDVALPDPFTGLYRPQNVQRAEVRAVEGQPVTATLDWVDLTFVPAIPVPTDAWIGWDAVGERFVTVGERHPAGLEARSSAVLHFRPDLWEKTWHDGTQVSIGDVILRLILHFDRAKPESPIFDEAAVPAFHTFQGHFRGVRILDTDPLVAEVYSDLVYVDAEWIASGMASLLYPYHDRGPGPWHKLALGIRAEAARELAFSSAKARRLGVEWTSYVAGPSILILSRHLDAAAAEGYLPYANTLRTFISAAEVAARYAALRGWYQTQGHLWVGNGPFYLDVVRTVERVVVLRRCETFPDPAAKYAQLGTPPVATVTVLGPTTVTRGQEAVFELQITFGDQPYPTADLEFVKYLLFDPTETLVTVGDADAEKDGLWTVRLSADATAKLPVGVNRLEVAVASRLVGKPSFAQFEFAVR